MNISRRLSIAIIILLAIIPTEIICQHKSKVTDSQIKDDPGVYLTTYRLSLPPPKEFTDFDNFELTTLSGREDEEIKIDRQDNAPIGGRLETTGKTIYKFKRALLIMGKDNYEQLEFTTVKVKGVSYSFEGRLLERPEDEGANYTVLRGA